MSAVKSVPAGVMTLQARTAEEMMTPSPLSVREDITLKEAIAFLVDRNISAAPVTDAAGRPVGVLSRSDVVIHDREEADEGRPDDVETGSPLPRFLWGAFQVERVDSPLVRDVMTPAVFCVAPTTSAKAVVEQMREINVHRLFVVNANGTLAGVITAMDVVRQLVRSR